MGSVTRRTPGYFFRNPSANYARSRCKVGVQKWGCGCKVGMRFPYPVHQHPERCKMARQPLQGLTQSHADKEKRPGKHAYGLKLYLVVDKPKKDDPVARVKRWVYRYKVQGKEHQLGCGSFRDTTLDQARYEAARLTKVRKDGIDPSEERLVKRHKAAAARVGKTQVVASDRKGGAKPFTFRWGAELYIERFRPGWKGNKNVIDWEQSLHDHVYPWIQDMLVKDIRPKHVVDIMERLWRPKAPGSPRGRPGSDGGAMPTAMLVRGRIKQVYDWVRGEDSDNYKDYPPNPADKKLLAGMGYGQDQIDRLSRKERQPYLPYQDVSTFIADLQGWDGVVCDALEFHVLTVPRSSNSLEARWDQITCKNGHKPFVPGHATCSDECRNELIWTIPWHDMKEDVEHQVPLSAPAIAIIERMYENRQGPLIFPGENTGRAKTPPVLHNKMSDMGYRDKTGQKWATPHGFRRTFSTWAHEETYIVRNADGTPLLHDDGEPVRKRLYDDTAIEMCLAHKVGGTVSQGYNDSEQLRLRRSLMNAWGVFCYKDPRPNVPRTVTCAVCNEPFSLEWGSCRTWCGSICRRALVRRNNPNTGRRQIDLPIEEMKERRNNGESFEAIGDAFGTKADTVADRLRDAGEYTRRAGPRHPIDEIIKLHNEGYTGSEIGAKLDLSRGIVNRLLRKAGITRQEEFERARHKAESIVELNREGYTGVAIATKLGISTATVSRVKTRTTEVLK
jgi:integrase